MSACLFDYRSGSGTGTHCFKLKFQDKLIFIHFDLTSLEYFARALLEQAEQAQKGSSGQGTMDPLVPAS